MRLLPLFLLIFLFFFLDVNAQRRTTTAKPDSTATQRTSSRGRGRSRFVPSAEQVQPQTSPRTQTEPISRRIASRKRVINITEERIPPRVVGTLIKTENFARVPSEVPKPEIPSRVSNSPRVPNFVRGAEVAEKKTFKHERRPSSRNSYEVLEVLDDLPEFQPIRQAKEIRDFESKNPNRRNSLQKLPTESPEALKSTAKGNFPRRNPLQKLPTESPEAFKSTARSNSPRQRPLQNLPTENLEAFKSTSSEASHSPAEETNIVEDIDDTTLNTLPLEVSSELSVPEEPLADIKTQPLGDDTMTPESVRFKNNRRNGARRNPIAIDQTTHASRSRTRTKASKVPDVAEPVRSSRRRVGPSVFTAEGYQNESPRSRSSRKIESSREKISTDFPSTRRSRRNSTQSSEPQKTRETSYITSSRTIESPPDRIHIDLASTRRSRRNTTPSSAQQKIGEASTRKSITKSSKGRTRSREVPPVIDETKLEVLPLFETEPRLVNSVGAGDEQSSGKRKIMPDNSTETKKVTSSRVRESVVSEVSQVISRGTVARRKELGVNIKAFNPLARGSKRAEPKQSERVKGSSEEIDDADNYPEPFKALIKAMKGKKESSAGKIAESRPGLTNSVTSSPSSVSSPVSSTTVISVTAKEINGLDNEIFSKQPSMNTPSPRNRSPRPTNQPSSGKFNPPARKRANGGIAFKPKGSRADRRERRNGEHVSKQQEPKLVAAVEKPGRRKYNSDLASRSTLPRFTTNAPRYIPTIPSMPYVPTVPTITLPRTSVYSEASKKDPDLGVEVISFDDPIPPLPSENLVRDASVSFTENQFSLALPLVSEGTTEKPVSIFERIINSLTAISTPPPVNSTVSTATESTSAILKLAPTKPDTVTLTHTTDKSTTIIERILSSINAIQATDDSRAPQVRTDFNTLSFTTTTPALYSTSSIDPLSVLDDITPEQALQKRTIGKLLEILNGMISTTMQPSVVVVTPKSFNFATDVNTDSSTTPLLTSTEIPSTTLLTSTEMPLTTLLTSTESISTTLIPSTEMTSTTLIPSIDDSTTVTEPFSDMELLGTSTITTITDSKSSTTTENTSASSTENAPASSTESSSFPSTSEVGLTHTVDPYTLTPLFSTLPALEKFEVSPGSVSVFSANDLFNSVTPDDDLSTTISIQSRSNAATTLAPTTTESLVGTTQEVVTTTLNNPTTTLGVNRSVVTNRSGRLLNVLQDPVQNSIDFASTSSTTPAYYVFAVLNNNTILRKDPPRVASDEKAPYLVVGVYPDNTVVRRYPNGTVVPRERVIRVRGFDTRENPPPLPEITSNQVTFDRGVSKKEDGRHFQTAEQNSLPSIEASPLSDGRTGTIAATNLSSTSTPERSPRTNNKPFTVTPRSGAARSAAVAPRVDGTAETNTTLSALSELFDGRTLDALNEILNSTKTNTDITPQGIKYNNVLNIQDLLKSQTAGQPIMSVTPTIFTKVDSTTLQPESSTVGTTVAPSTTTETVFTTTSFKVTTEYQATISNEISEGKSTTREPITSFPTITTTKPAPTTTSSTTTPSLTTTTTTVPTTTTTKKVTTSTADIPFTTKSIRLTTTPTKVPLRLPAAAPTAPLFPTFITTLFPNLFTADTLATRSPRVLTTNSPGVIRISAAPSVTENLLVAASTPRASTVAASSTITMATSGTTIAATTTTPMPTTTVRTTVTTTTPRTIVTTTTRMTPTTTTSSTTERTTTPRTSTTEQKVPVTDFNTEVTTKKKLKELTAEQKENLKTLMQLEKDQAALLQQLSFLTNLNLGGRTATPKKITTQKSSTKDLAERVVALAVERDKNAKTTTRKPPASIQDQLAAIDATRQPKKLAPSIEEVLKQYNLGELDVAATPSSSYGKSNDAILASILKQQGISPPTPKILADQIKQAGLFEGSTTRKPKPKQKPRPRPTTTQPPGRLMQGLNWLLNALAPPPPSSPRPAKRPVKPKRPPTDQQELFATSPTHVTPVVTTAPKKQAAAIGSNSLTQEDIRKLIAQLEGLQEDTSGKTLDLSQVKSLQNLINIDEGVVVLTNGEHGATSRRTTTSRPTSSGTPKRPTSVRTTRKRQERKLTTVAPLDTVSNFVEEEELDEFEVTTKKHRAPIGFRPVPGLDDDSSDSLIRSNLITAAVNVTKAISGFLGTALQTVSQGAAQSFQSLWGAGSSLGTRVLEGAASGSSAGPG